MKQIFYIEKTHLVNNLDQLIITYKCIQMEKLLATGPSLTCLWVSIKESFLSRGCADYCLEHFLGPAEHIKSPVWSHPRNKWAHISHYQCAENFPLLQLHPMSCEFKGVPSPHWILEGGCGRPQEKILHQHTLISILCTTIKKRQPA